MSARDFFAVADRRFRRRRSSSSSVVADVGRRRRRASIISLFRPREGPLKKIKFSMFFKNSQSFWNSRFLAKWVHEIFSPSSVVHHFPFSSKGGTFEKNQIFVVFQKLAIFLKFKIFGKMSARDFFAVVGRPSFPFFVQGRDLWKKSNFRCFSKTRNLSKIQDFWQNECTRFFRRRRSSFSSSSVVVFVGRRRRRSSPSPVVHHFPFSSKGGTFEKNQIFAVFQKLAIFLKFKIFGKMSARDFFAVVGPSVISLFCPREGPLKKIKFSLFFKNSQSF